MRPELLTTTATKWQGKERAVRRVLTLMTCPGSSSKDTIWDSCPSILDAMSKSMGLAWARWSGSASADGLVASATASTLGLGFLLLLSQDKIGFTSDVTVVGGAACLAAFDGLAQRDRATLLPVAVPLIMGDTLALMLRSAAWLFVDIATPLADIIAFYRLAAGLFGLWPSSPPSSLTADDAAACATCCPLSVLSPQSQLLPAAPASLSRIFGVLCCMFCFTGKGGGGGFNRYDLFSPHTVHCTPENKPGH